MWSIRDFPDAQFYHEDNQGWHIYLNLVSDEDLPLCEYKAAMSQAEYQAMLTSKLQSCENPATIFTQPFKNVVTGMEEYLDTYLAPRSPVHPLISKRYALLTAEKLKVELECRRPSGNSKWDYVFAPTWTKESMYHRIGKAKVKDEVITCLLLDDLFQLQEEEFRGENPIRKQRYTSLLLKAEVDPRWTEMKIKAMI
eukprot:TRINITY_DN23015_c0_g1_i1.p1 TRINITY_DN23015_c0_g1~~TRINITY_DN23015_c0_g1_i1.p1  ORF type:complete len:197 (+),score=26.86 TRINITY_DN23015_c0_g1_i1:464-1054(+)